MVSEDNCDGSIHHKYSVFCPFIKIFCVILQKFAMTALRIAIRYLLARKSHTAVNVISYISMAGIAVAAMAMVCVLSVFNGFTNLAADRLSKVDPDIKITPKQGRLIPNADSLALVVSQIPGVYLALPALQSEALAIYGDRQIACNIRGAAVGHGKISSVSSLVIDGAMNPDTYHHRGAILSIGLANILGAPPSLEIPLYLAVPRRIGRINPAFNLAAFTTDTLFVTGIYRTNQSEYDDLMMFMPLDNARKLLDYTVEGSAIEVGLEDDVETPEMVEKISEVVGPDYLVADRLRQQLHSFRMIAVEKWITFLILVFVLIMASFNILSSLSMLIIEKTESLRILSSLGATISMLRRIFLYQGVLIAVTGGFIGIVIGIILCLIQQNYGIITLSGDHSQMSITTYPCSLHFTDCLITAAVVIAIGLISGLVTSRTVRPSALRNS